MAHRINDLWDSQDEKEWECALERYWALVKPENLDLEEEMQSLDRERIKAFSQDEWYKFLRDKYFRWKFTAHNRLETTSRQLKTYADANELGDLFSIKERIFAIDPEDVSTALETAQSIRGLGIAGASGLLAVLFPRRFGTVDQFVVKSLTRINSLADTERQAIKAMRPEALTAADAGKLIGIMRRKANELNSLFNTDRWTPRRIDMILWAFRT
jgi:hypothetical protein